VKPIYFLFLICLLSPLLSAAQDLSKEKPEKKKKQSLLSLMKYEEVIRVTLDADMTDLIEGKLEQKERVGSFSFMDSLGQKVTLPIRLETRGKTRLGYYAYFTRFFY